MIVIGLTGGIASGKSTVSETLSSLGAVIINADKIGHEAFQPNTEAWREVANTFGRGILKENGEIDRGKLGEIVFSDPEALKQLNQIMHPRMYVMMKEKIGELRKQGVEVVVLEAALLIEANWLPLVDEVWVTIAPESTVVKRLRDRNGLTESQALARIRSQLSNQDRVNYADVVIDTDCQLAQVRLMVERLWERLTSREPVRQC